MALFLAHAALELVAIGLGIIGAPVFLLAALLRLVTG